MSSFRSSKHQETPFTGPVWWQAALCLILALLVQMEALHGLTFRGAQPSLVLIVVVWYAINTDARRAALFGLVAGLCEDVFSARTGAAWTISTTATALLASGLSRGFFSDSVPVVAVAVAIATLVRRLIFWVAMALPPVNYPPGHASLHFRQTLWEALLNAALMTIPMLAVRWIEGRRVR